MKKILEEKKNAAAERKQNGNGHSNGHIAKGPGASASLKTAEEIKALVQIEAPTENALRTQISIPIFEMVAQSMECNNCYLQDRCKYYRADGPCYFKQDNRLENLNDIANMKRNLLIAQLGRLFHALYQEKLDGGVIDRNLSFDIDRTYALLESLEASLEPAPESLEIKAKGGAVSAILAALQPRKRAVKPVTGTIIDNPAQ
jgi:hypothetical protein